MPPSNRPSPAGPKAATAAPTRPVRRPAAEPPPDLAVRILYRDDDLLILNKPPGVPVHAGPRDKVSLEDRLPQLAFGRRHPPVLAHRLDRDTSGCLILAVRRAAMRRMTELFTAKLVDKTYWAVVAGTPAADSGTLDLPLLKRTSKHGWRMVVDPAGQPAVTDWRVLGRADGLAWLELKPRTGRTHQIRVHCAAAGWPVYGDAAYGRAPAGARLHLHARAVSLPFAPDRTIAAEAPLPGFMAETFEKAGWRLPG